MARQHAEPIRHAAQAQQRRMRPELVVGAVTIGAVGAAFGITPATATPGGYPSWQEVQAARRSTATAQAEAKKIADLVNSLQASADDAGRTAQIAAEKYLQAKMAVDDAKTRSDALAAQAAQASKAATTSRMRAGLLAANMARQGGGQLSLDLVLNGSKASDLLRQLSTVTQLSSQTEAIYKQAVADQRVAASATAQAKSAADEYAAREAAAKRDLDAATAAASAAQAAVTAQEQNQARLTEQVAQLRGTSTALAASYIEGQQAAAAASSTPSGGGSSGSSSGSGSSGSGSSGSGSSGSGSSPSGSPSSGTSSGSGSSGSGSGSHSSPPSGSSGSSSGSSGSSGSSSGAPTPNPSEVSAVLAYARSKIGDPYRFAGAGPKYWDCSGLTMMSFASIGIAIGGHSATAQYDTARSEGLLVPYADAEPGDLVFYTDGGGDMYHVAIYSGGGMMIEAPYDGVPVREVAVRSYQLVGKVARFTG